MAPRAVLVLRLLGLHHHDAGRQMGDAHGGFGGVDVLAAGAGGAHRVHADVLGADLDVHLLRLRQHGDGGGRRVDAARRLGRRHALDAVPAGLVPQLGEDALARDAGDDFLEAAGSPSLAETTSMRQPWSAA